MSTRRPERDQRGKTSDARPSPPRVRAAHARQRQRLIDACISALHVHGPSRTTVEKVVSIAKMSPGIVRFYFDSKAAMLVASLQFLAAEFEERVLLPVAALKSDPVGALESMVDLYLDPDIASPRKVSVWYAFWGEASSRQEYYDICGQQDERFAALVRDLIGALIAQSRRPYLDADGIALGLIGALEIMWQDFAFRAEPEIDRPAAKRRCMGYLKSIFPGSFAEPGSIVSPRPPLPRRAPGPHGKIDRYAAERAALFRAAWSCVGHESQLPRAGDFLTLELAVERALIVRDAEGTLHALRNSCPVSPHALAAIPSGRLDGCIGCRLHEVEFSLDGHRLGAGPALTALDLARVGGLLFVRSPTAAGAGPPLVPMDGLATGLAALRLPTSFAVAADWQVVVEQWLEPAPLLAMNVGADSIGWDAPALDDSWSGQHYLRLLPRARPDHWRRCFVAPSQLFEIRPDGLSIIEAVPVGPGHCVVRRFDFTALSIEGTARAAVFLAQRLTPYARRSRRDLAESVQAGMTDFGYGAAANHGAAPAVDWLRHWVSARMSTLNLG